MARETATRAHVWLVRSGYLVAAPGVSRVVTPVTRWPEEAQLTTPTLRHVTITLDLPAVNKAVRSDFPPYRFLVASRRPALITERGQAPSCFGDGPYRIWVVRRW
jgi:hypothetical protein